MREIRYIVIHCTATVQNASIEAIKRYWKEVLNWKNPGYHIMVKPSGERVNVHTIEKVANGVAGYNLNSIHVSYIGGVRGKEAVDNRTPEQKAELKKIVLELKERFPEAEIKGHRDFPNVRKDCPSFDVSKWLKDENI